MTYLSCTRGRNYGFSLIELTIVLVIIALLTSGLLISFSTQKDIADTSAAEKQLASAHDALIGFAASQGRLPCPDTNLDGTEDTAAPACTAPVETTTCAALEGTLPHATLGLSVSDPWGSRLRYRVTEGFARRIVTYQSGCAGAILSSVSISLATPGDISIRTRGDNPTTTPAVETKFELTLASGVPAVIVSHGKNRFGAIPAVAPGAPLAAPAANQDEITNYTPGTTKWSRPFTAASSSCSDVSGISPLCEFDDSIVWVSRSILFNRLIAAGRLP